MRRAVAVVGLLVALPSGVAAQTPEPSTSQLAASVTVYDPTGLVTVYALERSVTSLRTEVEVGAETIVTISSDVLFAFDSAELTTIAADTVEDLAGRIAGSTGPVSVVGHTDSVGDEAYNLNLSNRRASAVGDDLRASLPAGTRIGTEGRGAREPVAPNSQGGQDSPDGRAKNRRVTITFTPKA